MNRLNISQGDGIVVADLAFRRLCRIGPQISQMHAAMPGHCYRPRGGADRHEICRFGVANSCKYVWPLS